MYGLEKNPKGGFEFDLEQDLKKDPNKLNQMLKTIEARIQEVKGILRGGAGSEDFDNFGVLLHGYAALQKVLNKVGKSRK